MSNVAVIGLGIMGLPMAINLVKAGLTVTGFNRSPARPDALVTAASRSSPIRVASSTALIVTRSMNSSIEGRIERVIAKTVPVALSIVGNAATRVVGCR